MAVTRLALHERMHFDLAAGQVLDGPRRYLLMRADVLMGAFDTLPDPLRERALQALGQAVARQGGLSVRAYLAELGAENLLQAMVDGSASLGWGCWQWQTVGGELHLFVRNSPFAAATQRHDQPACHAIAGMLSAVASALWSVPARGRELQCACALPGRAASCHFVATQEEPASQMTDS